MTLPGNRTHQKILQILINLFKKDNNILVFGLFGSLAWGNWDDYSDLDLDVVVKDDSVTKIKNGFNTLLKSLAINKLNILLYFEEYRNEWVIILDSLDRISIRFHLKGNTVYHILDSLQILYGKMTIQDLKNSLTKQNREEQSLELLKDKFIEISIYVPISLHRKQLINAEFFLNKMRNTIIEIYTGSRNRKRYFDFEKIAEPILKERISKTYSSLDEASIKNANHDLIMIFRDLIDIISNKKISLTKNDKALLDKVLKY